MAAPAALGVVPGDCWRGPRGSRLAHGRGTAMPRFYFDTHGGAKHVRDDEALPLSGLDDAREHALRAAGEMVKTALPDSAHRFVAIAVLGEDRPPFSRFRSPSRFRPTGQSCRAASG